MGNMALKVSGPQFLSIAYRSCLRNTRPKFGSSMGKDGCGCFPRIGKRAPAFSASFIENRHVVEVLRDHGVSCTERLFGNCQRALVEALRFTVPALVSIHVG